MKLSGRIITIVVAVICLFSIAGCGSGGGGNNNGVVSLSSAPTASATLQIANATLQLNGTTNVTATVLNGSGQPISGATVSFSTTVGSISPATGTATTDATGAATVQLLAGNTPGTGIVTANATIGGVTVSRVATFSVAFPTINLSAPVLGLSNLAAGGSTSVTVNLTDANGNPFTTPVDVSFSSNFASTGKASLLTPVRSVNGQASSTYTANGGVGTDTITVSVGSTSVSAQVTIAGTSASSISFVSATPAAITLKGMGGVGGSETSIVVFKVLDNNGQPKAGQTVDFALNTGVGGLTLTSPSGSSDSNGQVSTIVQAGIVATPVRVTASIRGSSPLIATQSDQLTVSTGIPTQSGMSLAVVTHNIEAFNIDGTPDTFTVFLSDHYGNPVPNGTVVNFSAQAGQVVSSCTTANGRCAVTWTSSGDRTPDGRAAILAYAIGEESFSDPNGNGVADGPSQAACLAAGSLQNSVTCGEFTDTTQAWRDDAHTGVYAPSGTVLASFPGFQGDLFIDFNGSTKVDRDGTFNGVLRPSAVTGPRTKHVFQNNVIVMSTSTAKINDFNTPAADNILEAQVTVGTTTFPGLTSVSGSVQDSNTLKVNPMAAGSSIAITSLNTCLSVAPSSFTVPNTVSAPTLFTTVVTNNCGPGVQIPGTLLVTVTSPSGLATTKAFTFNW